MPENLENSAVASGLEKVSFHSNPKERQCQRKAVPKNVQTTAQLLISYSSKEMLKILQARLQQYMNQELPYVQEDLEKAEESEIKLPTSIGSYKKKENPRKTSTSASLTTLKPLFSVQFSHPVVSDSLRPHEPQHARPPCPSPTPEIGRAHV